MSVKTPITVPNTIPIAIPDPNVAIGHMCAPFKVEMVIRGYLSGHAAREYKAGKRLLCGVPMPEGMKENDKFPKPIITPSTKADNGDHDEDITREAILSRGIVSEEDYKVLEDYTRKLFQRGTEIAAKRGLILVDTKYEFGIRNLWTLPSLSHHFQTIVPCMTLHTLSPPNPLIAHLTFRKGPSKSFISCDIHALHRLSIPICCASVSNFATFTWIGSPYAFVRFFALAC